VIDEAEETDGVPGLELADGEGDGDRGGPAEGMGNWR